MIYILKQRFTKMIELLLSLGPKPNNYPVISNTGPGPTTLLKYDADSDTGLFGDMSNLDFFTADQIEAKALVALEGDAISRDIARIWVKYYYKGKVLFIPKRPLRTKISWNNLYNAGFIYGEDGPGAFPPTTGAVNQLRTITLSGSGNSVVTFKIRGINTSKDKDPATNITPGDGAGATKFDPTVVDSEYSRLIERTIPTNGIDFTWATYGSTTTIPGRITYSSGSADRTRTYVAGLNNNAYVRNTGVKTAVTTVAQWLPVLELVSVTTQ